MRPSSAISAVILREDMLGALYRLRELTPGAPHLGLRPDHVHPTAMLLEHLTDE